VPLEDAAAYGTLDTSDKRMSLVTSILNAGGRPHSPEQQAIAQQLLYAHARARPPCKSRELFAQHS
jgi:hypothetical protein